MSTPPITSAILANLSPSLFQAGPKDVVATPDIYTLSSSTINANQTVNTNVGKFNPTSGSLINNLLSGSSGILSGITTALGLAVALSNPASLTNPSTLARLASAAGIPVSSMPSSVQLALNQSVNLNSNNYNSLVITSGNVTQSVTTGDVAGATSILGLVNALSGSSSYVVVTDVGPQTSVVSAVVSGIISMGLSSTLEGFLATQSTPVTVSSGVTTQTVAQVALQQNVQAAIQASDLTAIQLCITSLGVGGVLAQMPNAALALVSGYKMPPATTGVQYAALWQSLLAIIVQLAPNWNTVLRNGVATPCLTYFTAASKDCLTLMATDTAHEATIIGAAIGSAYKPEAALTTLQSMYPYMLIIPVQNSLAA